MAERLAALKRGLRRSETSLIEDAFEVYCGSQDPALLERQKSVLGLLAKEATKSASEEAKIEAPKPTRPGTKSGSKSAK
jgi:hypothetical protein